LLTLVNQVFRCASITERRSPIPDGVTGPVSAGLYVFIFTYSQQILGIFNPAYPAIAGTSLRLLGFSLLGSTIKFHACTLVRLSDAMGRASLWFALGALLELGFVISGAKFGGLQGLVLGWTLAVSIEGACMVLVWAFTAKWGLAAPVQKLMAPPPLQI
jgi:hypothetical protein